MADGEGDHQKPPDASSSTGTFPDSQLADGDSEVADGDLPMVRQSVSQQNEAAPGVRTPGEDDRGPGEAEVLMNCDPVGVNPGQSEPLKPAAAGALQPEATGAKSQQQEEEERAAIRQPETGAGGMHSVNGTSSTARVDSRADAPHSAVFSSLPAPEVEASLLSLASSAAARTPANNGLELIVGAFVSTCMLDTLAEYSTALRLCPLVEEAEKRTADEEAQERLAMCVEAVSPLAALEIQRVWRGWTSRDAVRKRRAARRICAWLGGIAVISQANRIAHQKRVERHRSQSAANIQKMWRGYSVRKKQAALQKRRGGPGLVEPATCFASEPAGDSLYSILLRFSYNVRRRVCRRRKAKGEAAVRIQKCYRGHAARRGIAAAAERRRRESACVAIQAWYRRRALLLRRSRERIRNAPAIVRRWLSKRIRRKKADAFRLQLDALHHSTRKIQALWRGAFHRRHVWPALRKKLLQNKSIGKDRELERAMQRLLEIRMEEFIPQKRDMVNKACNHLQILSITDGSPFARHAWWNVKRLDGLASPTSSITDTDSTPSPRSVTEIVETEYKEALFGRRLAERVADDRNVKPDPPQGTDQLQGKWTLPLTCSVFRAHSVALRQTKTVSDCVKVNDWLTNLRAYDRLELLPVRRPRHRVQDRASQPQNPPVEEVPSTPGEAESSPPDSVTSSALDLYFGPQLSRRRRLLHRTDAASLAKARPYYPPPTRLEIPENGPQHAGDQSADPGATGRSTASTVSTASQANSSFPPVARPCTVPAGRLFRSGVADNKSSVGNGSGKAGASFPAVAGGRGKDVLAPVMALRQTGWGMLLLEEAVAENIPSDEAQAREAGFGTACGNVVFPARTRTAHDKLHATPIHQLRKANKAGLSVHHKTRRPQWVG